VVTTESALATPMPEEIADKLNMALKTMDNKLAEEITFLFVENLFLPGFVFLLFP
jgi:hypothetical protein